MRQLLTQSHWDDLHAWMQRERQRVPDGSGIARALDYNLNRWEALSHFLADGEVSSHNNHLENLLRPWAMGRKAWLFAGSELAGQRAAGALPPHACAATAADGSNAVAMLVRRDNESLDALLERLDKAIGLAWSDDLFIDEVNNGHSHLL